MTVRFSFDLEDHESENLVGIIRADCLDNIKKSYSEENPDRAEWHRKRAVYVQGLLEKIVAGNTRVE